MAFLFQPVKFIKESSVRDENFQIDRQNEITSSGEFSGSEAKKFYENLLNDDEKATDPTEKRIASKPIRPIIKLSKHKGKLNVTDRRLTMNVLFKASSEGELDLVESCLKNGLNVNSQDDFKWTPLMCAAFAGFYDVVEHLLMNGSDKNLKNLKGQTAADLAMSNGFFHVAQLIEYSSHKYTPDKSNCSLETHTANYFCDGCRIRYTAPDHKTSTLHLLKTSKLPEERPFFHIPGGNKGYQLMVREGWNERSGLGLDGKGRKYPIRTSLKRDRLGLGSKTVASAKVTHFAPFDIEAIRSTKQERISVKRRLNSTEAKRKETEVNFRREFY